MSCESCTGCFETTPCSTPTSTIKGSITKEYLKFVKAATACEKTVDKRKPLARGDHEDHAFNTMISILANRQFTAQTYLTMSLEHLGSDKFLRLARSLAHHGFWGRLITWAFLFVKEDSLLLQSLLDKHDQELLQHVNDEAEIFELFNPAVSDVRRVVWSSGPIPGY
ncbi:hypothetical protein BX616_000652 [Lobosporangium transversale]|uniref:Uncharacterized protein n=1 Tax=Lobosporangium transversale TaxID=64571 RepID=A0A1Y2H0D6_9FUNG|nr:hypothetical protein BCR41DRAFT_346412 [Lobosporangium transversale]KAF9917546.1 hypothetical protein BX616_000652 [Lobosporangium transversale]ORZ28017.1 hypothetical protein BCR41DRAFT_346412 [Lobosporangium transversale]|eukprot:XP_021885720.1 hypothetical protein BCR41DRAFT_346412 [Lobosporangium transversale]